MLSPHILNNVPTSAQALAHAAQLSGDDGVVVVQILGVHGSGWGLPNPGLLPNQRERDAADAHVGSALTALRDHGVEADGEILVTRKDAQGISRIALRRGVVHVLVETVPTSPVRRFIEGDLTKSLRRRLPSTVTVQGVSAEVQT